MPEPTKIPRPFADSGDKNSIPDSSGGLGFASWQEGFPVITGTPFAQGGVAPKRADFNGIFNALSAAIVWNQQGGFYAYDNTTDYEIGNIVFYSGGLYVCLVANGPSSAVKDPTDATAWVEIATLAKAVPISGNASTPMTGNLWGGTGGDWYISMAQNSNIMLLRSATSVDNGGSLRLYGEDQASNPGKFKLSAANHGQYIDLTGSADGTLTWGGNNVPTVDSGTWTPLINGSSNSGDVTSSLTAKYVKIGPLVYCYATGNLGPNDSGTGALVLRTSSLPYTLGADVVDGIMFYNANPYPCYYTSSRIYFRIPGGNTNLGTSDITASQACSIAFAYNTTD